MAAYLTGHIRVLNVAKWHDYLSQVDATITAHGGEILLRGLQHEVKSSPGHHDEKFERLVVLRFADMAALERWYASSEYAKLKPLRAEAADVTVVTYESDSHKINTETASIKP